MLPKRKKIASHYFLSTVIRADAVMWGDQNKEGKTKSIFKIKRNRP
jgi:hypothetical protein